MTLAPTVLFVPGLRDHVPEHWQTLLEQKLPKATLVPRMEQRQALLRRVGEQARPLARADRGPVVLVAHSAGVMITVHWAQRHQRPIKGALLAAPADFESPLPAGYPSQETLMENGWLPTPRTRLPFPEHRRGEHKRSARDATSASRRSPRHGAAASSTSATSAI